MLLTFPYYLNMDLDESLRRRLYVSFITIGIFFPLVTFFFLQFFLVKSFAKADIQADASRVTVAIDRNWKTLAKGSQINSFHVVALTVSKIKDVKLRSEAETMIDSISGYRMRVEGEGDYVRAFASKGRGVYYLLLANYDPKNKNKELALATLTHLENGTYKVTITTVGGTTVIDKEVVVTNGVMKRSVFMGANQITMLKLERQK